MGRQNADYERIVREVGAVRLRAIRAEAGQSQAEFAERLGLGVKTYGNYERQQRELPQSARLAIIDQTDMDPLPTEALHAALRGIALPAPEAQVGLNPNGAAFWANLRAECRAASSGAFVMPTPPGSGNGKPDARMSQRQ
ncbi:helix-turn-helix domain-containing protein [Sedimentitalea sp. XS_ASV28]|uniref:helix-turn-helix domain-containing protein n=1 Tax=Sedimentitalea sp. XS_ASV28 TaxID=3241296 RepID=UPI0035127950